jgi:hypothetical protein
VGVIGGQGVPKLVSVPSTEQALQQRIARHAVVRRHAIEDRREGADAQRVVVGDGHVMLT